MASIEPTPLQIIHSAPEAPDAQLRAARRGRRTFGFAAVFAVAVIAAWLAVPETPRDAILVTPLSATN